MSESLLPPARWKRILISLLIGFHLLVVPVGSFYAIQRFRSNGLQIFLARYVDALRVRQVWALFSPNPRKYAVKYFAIIKFQDGSFVTWSRHYPPKWDFFQRHLAYAFQRWDTVSDYLDMKSGLWDCLVDYLQTLYRSPMNPVVEIRLVRSSAPWPPPRPTGYVGGDVIDLKWSDQTLFTYDASHGGYL